MLSRRLQPNTRLIGLSELVNSGRPGFDGRYRVVPVGSVMAIEFFDAATRGADATTDPVPLLHIRILPYRTQMINEIPMEGKEVISGPFTGCVMSLYNRGGVRTVGHVDTNPDTTQRAAYSALQSAGTLDLISEYDTTGKLDPDAGSAQVIFCIAHGTQISRFLVRKEVMAVSTVQKANPLFGRDKDMWFVHDSTVYTVLREL